MPSADIAPKPTADAPLPVFAPTLREVMLRPWWLGMLGVALVIASVFAWLGQWQLGSAIDTSPPPPGQTEQVRPLADVVQPGEYLPEPIVGQRVEVSGSFVPGDFRVVSSRFDDGAEGFWVVGQFRVQGDAPASTAAGSTAAGSTAPVSIAVAVGWTASRDEADEVAAMLDADPPRDIEVTGRLIADEGTELPPRGADPRELTRVSSAALLSEWSDIEGLDVYRGYITAAEPAGTLTAIHSPAPDERSSVNWLNIFYAAEWAVFAGFAFYMWYRLAKDAWEKELEELEDAAAGAAPARD